MTAGGRGVGGPGVGVCLAAVGRVGGGAVRRRRRGAVLSRGRTVRLRIGLGLTVPLTKLDNFYMSYKVIQF